MGEKFTNLRLVQQLDWDTDSASHDGTVAFGIYGVVFGIPEEGREAFRGFLGVGGVWDVIEKWR